MANMVLDYLIIIPGNICLSVLAGLGWALKGGFFSGGAVLIVLYISAYETGYKKYYRQSERHKYFYFAYVLPAFFATVAFLFGLFYMNIV